MCSLSDQSMTDPESHSFFDDFELNQQITSEDGLSVSETDDSGRIFADLPARTQSRKKQKFRATVQSSIKELFEIGRRSLTESLATKYLLEHILDSFETDLRTMIHYRIEKQGDREIGMRISESFRSLPLLSK